MRDYAECSVIAKRLRFLADDLENAYGAEEGESLFADAADAIVELLAAVPKWISVEERLPEIGRIVLTSDGEDVWTNWMLRVGNKGIVEIQWAFNEEEVTHWMPLPESPKEE